MAAKTLSVPAAVSETPVQEWATAFTLSVTKNETVVLELFGYQSPDSPEVRVLAYVRNVRAIAEHPPQRMLHSFPDREHAQRFVDEALICFEYLGCTISIEH